MINSQTTHAINSKYRNERPFSESEKRQQLIAIICNHKKTTARAANLVTGFGVEYCRQVYDSLVDEGMFRKTASYTHEGQTINEECYRSKKLFLQAGLFGDNEQEKEEDFESFPSGPHQ